MKKLIALVLIFKCTVACSQNLRAEIDSLQRVLLQTQNPAAKINIMSALCSDYGKRKRSIRLREDDVHFC